MITYKGFNGDMTCRGFAFREGERSEESEAQAGRCGFHSAVNPLDVLAYYPSPLEAVYYVCGLGGHQRGRERFEGVVDRAHADLEAEL